MVTMAMVMTTMMRCGVRKYMWWMWCWLDVHAKYHYRSDEWFEDVEQQNKKILLLCRDDDGNVHYFNNNQTKEII